VNLTERQHEVLTRMARGGVLFVRLEPSEEGTQQTCWIGTVDLPSMTVNALITARLIEPDTVVKNARQVTTSYFMNIAGRAARERAAGRRARTEPLGPEEGAQQAPPRRQEIRPGPYA
jgi:hypothetical protein